MNKIYKPTKDLRNQIYTRWTVLDFDQESSNNHNCAYWICRCECGTIKSVCEYSLLNGISKSCGCLSRELTSKRISRVNEIFLYEEVGYGIAYFNNSNEYFMFDIEDVDVVRSRCWHKNSRGYATSNPRSSDDSPEVLFHRLVLAKYMDVTGIIVDHRNSNQLDNRKCNLWAGTQSNNLRNTPPRSNTGEKHIHYDAKHDSYLCSIKYDGKYKQTRHRTMEKALEYRNSIYQSHPEISKYLYDPNNDWRNDPRPVSLYDPSEVIVPFIMVDNA